MEIILILIGIFLLPILGFLLSRLIVIEKNLIKIGFYTLITIIVLLSFFKIINLYFDYSRIYYYLFLLVYLIYCVLIFSIRKQRELKHHKILFLIGLLPIIIIYIVGFIILPFIGFLSWGLNETYKTQSLKNNYYFTIKYSGNVSSEWIDLDVNKKIIFVPFMHKEIYHTSLNSERIDKSLISIDFKDTQEYYKIRINESENLNIDTLIKK